jgi:hypothetical protein
MKQPAKWAATCVCIPPLVQSIRAQTKNKNPPDRINITYRHLRLHHLAHHTHTMLPFFFTVSTTAAAAAAAGLSYILYAVI